MDRHVYRLGLNDLEYVFGHILNHSCPLSRQLPEDKLFPLLPVSLGEWIKACLGGQEDVIFQISNPLLAFTTVKQVIVSMTNRSNKGLF